MLAIRMQRKGRTHAPTYRIVVQESQRHPLSGRVVAEVGNYNPATKALTLDKEAVEKAEIHCADSADFKRLYDATMSLLFKISCFIKKSVAFTLIGVIHTCFLVKACFVTIKPILSFVCI